MNNKSYHSEKSATDKGWKAMQEILDREMPAERPRRRAFVILYRLAAVLLPLIGALAWFTHNSGFGAAPVLPTDQPVAERPAGKTTQPDMIALKPVEPRKHTNEIVGATAHSTPETRSNNDATPGTTTKTATRQKHGNPSDTDNKQPAAVASKEKETSPAPKKNAKKGTVNQPIVNGAIAPALHASAEPKPVLTPAETIPPGASDAMPAESPALAAIEPNPVPTTTQPAISATEPAPVAPVASTDTLVQTALPLAPPIEPVREKSLHWGATTGAFSDMAARFGGATAGLTLDWKVGQNWGLRSGLAYQYHALQDNDRPLTTVTTATYAEATGDQKVFDNGGFITTAADLTTPVYVTVSRLHRVEMPLLAYWQPVPNVRVFGGASIGATAYAEVENQSFKGFNVYDLKAGTPTRNLNSRVSDQVRSLDVRWNIGASIRVVRSVELGLFFQSPIRALSDTNWLAADTGASTPNNLNPDLEALATERQNAANNRSLFQFLATVFF